VIFASYKTGICKFKTILVENSLTAVNIKAGGFWEMTPCSLQDGYQYFGEAHFLHNQGLEEGARLFRNLSDLLSDFTA
jgi:hypothetical protein